MRKKILLFATTSMDLEPIMLNEVSQKKTSTVWDYLHVESKKKLNLFKRKTEWNVGYQRVRRGQDLQCLKVQTYNKQ